jgi:hypothetical protein
MSCFTCLPLIDRSHVILLLSYVDMRTRSGTMAFSVLLDFFSKHFQITTGWKIDDCSFVSGQGDLQGLVSA